MRARQTEIVTSSGDLSCSPATGAGGFGNRRLRKGYVQGVSFRRPSTHTSTGRLFPQRSAYENVPSTASEFRLLLLSEFDPGFISVGRKAFADQTAILRLGHAVIMPGNLLNPVAIDDSYNASFKFQQSAIFEIV
jgi:hypothetical protein